MIDCFTFFNELDLLEIRLNSLAPFVEKFVLCECAVTYSGNPKPLFFLENKSRFKDFNITHLIVDHPEKYLKDAKKEDPLFHYSPRNISRDAWLLENDQREYLMNGIKDVGPETIILISDLDEIPDLTTYIEGMEGPFRQKLYYYYFNTFTGKKNWKGTIACRKKNIPTLNSLRDNRWRVAPVGLGWHFSTLGSIDNIRYKIESYAHIEHNTEMRKKKIAENMVNLLDPYDRNADHLIVEMPSGPEWLVKNKEKYEHMFYKSI
jgi:beta-1,4-mannosyl-glycoprotein beta-1,4-N-acetylglucosaminyltransferase